MTLSPSRLTTFLLILSSLTFVGCGGAKKKSDSGAPVDSTQSSDEDTGNSASGIELNADSDSGKAGPLRSVYFGFNSSQLTSDSRSALSANAEFLKSNTSIKIEVEGHCDERGSVQYNLALGERRAKTVKDYLSAMGVERSRMSTISFGKERPVSFGHDEGAWSQNRRANFIVTAK